MVYPAVAANCSVSGQGLSTAMVRQTAKFVITAKDADGNACTEGGEVFTVAVRGASLVKARVLDNEDGTYQVEYKPSVSGRYTISVALGGQLLEGSPFGLNVLTPQPDPTRCVLRGEALRSAKARENASFEIEFVDALGQVAHAEDLDVYVEAVERSGKTEPPKPVEKVEAKKEKEGEEGEEKEGEEGDEAGKGEEEEAKAAEVKPPAEGKVTSFKRGSVQVGVKPLIVRTDVALDSAWVGQLEPGQMATVLDEVITPSGDVRAKLALVEEEAGAGAIAESWWKPFDYVQALTSHDKDSPPGSPGRLISPGRYSPVFNGQNAFDARSRILAMRGSAPDGRPSSGGSDLREIPAYRPPGSPHGGDAFGQTPTGSWAGSEATTRSGGGNTTRVASAPARRPGSKPAAVGWVTLVKNGVQLVQWRPRLDAGERREHMQLWQRRMAADKAHDRATAAHASNTHSKSHKDGKGAIVGPSLAHELLSDPSGIGFAFGGVTPGTLHAHGQLLRVHTVKYTIGCAGYYKLHVGLRNQAKPLPGSPFDLYVEPSTAHALSTHLPKEALPLRGVVGDAWSCSCDLIASDRMGNRCVSGGAPIQVDVEGTNLEHNSTDNADGTYTLKWRGKVSGTYKTSVTISGAHVIGSPTTLTMLSGPPDVPKCEIAGGGLRTAVAGKPAIVEITCKDRFSNPLNSDSMQGHPMSFGLALLPPRSQGEGGAARDTVPSMPFESSWIKMSMRSTPQEKKEEEYYDEYNVKPVSTEVARADDEDGEVFEIQYMAKEAGDFELHAWCDPDGTGARIWLSGSPFTVRVSGVRPDPSGSFVGGADELLMNQVNAGDPIHLKPQLRDQFGNASSALEGAFQAHIEAPEPEGMRSLDLKALKGLGAYEIQHEVQLKGPHEIHLLLNGQHISGSPVCFNVHPDKALGSKSKLFPPPEAPVVQQTCNLLLEAIDRFGNKLETGGARIDARAGGPGVSTCSVKDLENGTYTVSFTAAVVGECRVIVRLDNVEMAPMKLNFVAPTDGGGGGDAPKKGRSVGGRASASEGEKKGDVAPAVD